VDLLLGTTLLAPMRGRHAWITARKVVEAFRPLRRPAEHASWNRASAGPSALELGPGRAEALNYFARARPRAACTDRRQESSRGLQAVAPAGGACELEPRVRRAPGARSWSATR